MFIRPGDRKTVFSNIANVKCTEFYNLRIIAAVNKTPGLSIIYRNDSIYIFLVFGTLINFWYLKRGQLFKTGRLFGTGRFSF